MEIIQFAFMKIIQTEQYLWIYNFENNLNLQFILLIYSTLSVIWHSMTSSYFQISFQSNDAIVPLMVDSYHISNILGLSIKEFFVALTRKILQDVIGLSTTVRLKFNNLLIWNLTTFHMKSNNLLVWNSTNFSSEIRQVQVENLTTICLKFDD